MQTYLVKGGNFCIEILYFYFHTFFTNWIRESTPVELFKEDIDFSRTVYRMLCFFKLISKEKPQTETNVLGQVKSSRFRLSAYDLGWWTLKNKPVHCATCPSTIFFVITFLIAKESFVAKYETRPEKNLTKGAQKSHLSERKSFIYSNIVQNAPLREWSSSSAILKRSRCTKCLWTPESLCYRLLFCRC